MAEKKRQQRTPRERAEIELGVAERKVKKLEGKINSLTSEAEGLKAELSLARKRLEYVRQSPDLQQPDAPVAVNEAAHEDDDEVVAGRANI